MREGKKKKGRGKKFLINLVVREQKKGREGNDRP